jgi:hypothetical protein
MPNTPVYAWPFQALNDSPDGAALGQNLALAIEATMQTVQGSISTLRTPQVVTDATARNALPNITVGLSVYRLDFKIIEIFDGVAWKPEPGTLIGSYIAANPQLLGNATVTAAALDGADILDIYNAHDPVVNNSRFTAPFDGRFVFEYGAGFAGNATGVRSVLMTKNGVGNTVAGSQSQIGVGGSAAPHSMYGRSVSVAMVAGDFCEMALFQNAGVGINTNLGNGDNPAVLVTYAGG